jgi:hypothetical protein
VWDAFKQSTESRPASSALIVQRRAAIQNSCRCPVEQNFWADPPVARGLKARPHQRQEACKTGFESCSRAEVADPISPFAAFGIPEVFVMGTLYESGHLSCNI